MYIFGKLTNNLCLEGTCLEKNSDVSKY